MSYLNLICGGVTGASALLMLLTKYWPNAGVLVRSEYGKQQFRFYVTVPARQANAPVENGNRLAAVV